MWVHPGTAQDKTATASRTKGRESGALEETQLMILERREEKLYI